MLVKSTCKKCGETFKLDIGDKSLPEIKKILAKRDSFECPGHHVEMTSPLNFWTFGEIIEGNAPTEAQWLAKMRDGGRKLYSNDEVRELFECTGFSAGMFIGFNKKTKEKVVLDFSTSPEGHRYYH